MQSIIWSASVFSSLCFLYYGLSLLLSQHMAIEFKRYGLSRYRRLTGVLQLTGSIGLIAGVYLPLLSTLASLGLVALMALGISARVRVRDSVWQMVPAILLLVLNTLIFLAATWRNPILAN